MSILDDVTQWADADGNRPPSQWIELSTSFVFGALEVYADIDALYDALGDLENVELAINYVGSAPLPSSLKFNFAYPVAADDARLVLATTLNGNFSLLDSITELQDPTTYTLIIPAGTTQFAWQIFAIENGES